MGKVLIEITKEQADCLADFLECEFIENLHKDEGCRQTEYVKSIYEVYKKVQEACADHSTEKGGAE